MTQAASPALTVTFAGSGDASGSGGRYQARIHLRPQDGSPVLLDCGATSLSALRRLGLEPGEITAGPGRMICLRSRTTMTPGIDTRIRRAGHAGDQIWAAFHGQPCASRRLPGRAARGLDGANGADWQR